MDFKIGESRKPQGSKKLTREREAYFLLMRQGVSNTEACRILGINRRTGKRWRHGTNPTGNKKGAPPAMRPAGSSSGPSRYLREADRIHIADRLCEKASVRQIAAELGRSPSSISREIRRNGALWRGTDWTYRPFAAQRREDQRRPAPSPARSARIPSCGTSSRTT